jgi:hypothetical protein
MPAAELSRLRVQINGLIAKFDDPTGLRNALRDMLEMYANRAYRAGQAVQAKSILPNYRVPPLVIRQLELELSKTCQEQPEAALNAVEALWHDAYLEPRLLATVLLGAIPFSYAEEVARKLCDWAQQEENSRMLDMLFENGTAGLRRSAPQILLAQVEEWISSPHAQTQALGVRALVPLIKDPSFENLPPVYRMLGPLVQHMSNLLQTDLRIAVEALARKSPTETAYFLRQALSISSAPGTARLIRQSMAAFSPAQQASLRAALQTASTK